MGLTEIQKAKIAAYFNGVDGVMRTNGTKDGIIVKFPDFYLSVSDAGSMNKFLVQKYDYTGSQPLSSNIVDAVNMHSFATQFRVR